MLFLISELVIRICLVCENPMNYIFEVYIQFCCGIFGKTKGKTNRNGEICSPQTVIFNLQQL